MPGQRWRGEAPSSEGKRALGWGRMIHFYGDMHPTITPKSQHRGRSGQMVCAPYSTACTTHVIPHAGVKSSAAETGGPKSEIHYE